MVKRVILVHGWGGRPDEGWLSWLDKELSSRGFEFYAPDMPDKENPQINVWVNYLKKIVKTPDKDTYLIGHSIGCQTILRYIETLPENIELGGILFVAGWLHLKDLETDEENEIAEPWLTTPINFAKIKPKIGNLVALFSDNDPYVPLEDSETLKEKLGAKIIIEKNKGHYIEDETKTIPVALNSVLEMAK